MTNSELFQKAHSMTRQTIAKHPGSDYQLTFGAALKAIKQAETMRKRLDIGEFLIDSGTGIILSAAVTTFMLLTFYIVGFWIGGEYGAFAGTVFAFAMGIAGAIFSVIESYDINSHHIGWYK